MEQRGELRLPGTWDLSPWSDMGIWGDGGVRGPSESLMIPATGRRQKRGGGPLGGLLRALLGDFSAFPIPPAAPSRMGLSKPGERGLPSAGSPGLCLAGLMTSVLKLLFSKVSFSFPLGGASQRHHPPSCKMRGLPTSPLLSGILQQLPSRGRPPIFWLS